eukprot:161548-Prorocentrum_lima.AAC.1
MASWQCSYCEGWARVRAATIVAATGRRASRRTTAKRTGVASSMHHGPHHGLGEGSRMLPKMGRLHEKTLLVQTHPG